MSTNGKTSTGTTPEPEPEYVGAYREPIHEYCAAVIDETGQFAIFCGEPATHTVVRTSDHAHQLDKIAMCDSCGHPEDASRE